MPITTEELALELCVSKRQVLNYKDAVESHIGKSITFRQGKQHFYHDKYVPLLRMYAKGEPLPPVEEQTTHQPPNPFEQAEQGGNEIILHTTKLPAPPPLVDVPVTLRTVDTSAIANATAQNWRLLDSFKTHIRNQVLADAESFGEELAAEVTHRVSHKVARAYREVIR